LTVLTTLTLSSRGGWCTPARVWWSLMGSLGVMLIGLLMTASAGLIVTPYVWVGQVVVIVLALVLFYVIQREQSGRHSVEYPLLLGFALLGLLLLLAARDLLLFVAAVELLSLTLYLLAALQNRSAYVVEAGMKYLVLGSLGSGLLLFGTTLLYGLSGLLNFTSLLYYFTSLPTLPFGLVLGVLFFLMGLLFKVAAFPFYVWAPDVYEGVPLPVTVFFAVIVKFTVFFVLVALLGGVFEPLHAFWGPLLVILGLLTLAVGAIGGLRQKRLKRLLAYSSISNAGFLLVALGALGLSSSRSVLYYLLVYTFTVFLLFLFLFLLNCRGGVVTYITDLSYCTNFPTVWLVLFTVATLSLAGMPPLVGFLAKYGVLFSVLHSPFH
jgi:NADH-quinone oxidoreductase subunit N